MSQIELSYAATFRLLEVRGCRTACRIADAIDADHGSPNLFE